MSWKLVVVLKKSLQLKIILKESGVKAVNIRDRAWAVKIKWIQYKYYGTAIKEVIWCGRIKNIITGNCNYNKHQLFVF